MTDTSETKKRTSKASAVVKALIYAIISLVSLAVLLVLGYLIYISANYYRIEDNVKLEVINRQSGGENSALSVGTDYTVTTYNIGFGAYTHDFTFFMDNGVMKDGTEVCGTGSRAESLETVNKNTNGAADNIAELNPDFCIFQEVDTDSTRSFHVDQSALISNRFMNYSHTFAVNFHSAYLFYPFTAPHGIGNSGLLTLSRYKIEDATRRSFPVDNSWPAKFFDLDRCFSVSRIPVEGGKYLVLINSHMSAFDEGGVIRAQQIKLLFGVMKDEAEKGNYVICGGDFNHAFPDLLLAFPSEQNVPQWVQVFDPKLIPEGFSLVMPENGTQVSTCRSTDIPYTKGVNYETVLDGFIVSDNIRATSRNIDTDYNYSDHNPVIMTFSLLDDADNQ